MPSIPGCGVCALSSPCVAIPKPFGSLENCAAKLGLKKKTSEFATGTSAETIERLTHRDLLHTGFENYAETWRNEVVAGGSQDKAMLEELADEAMALAGDSVNACVAE